MYDQEANTQTVKKAADRSERKTDAVRHAHGKHNPMCLRVGYGNQLYVGFVGKRGGQRRDFQDDFTRVFYSYRRHDWVPEWYQTHAK